MFNKGLSNVEELERFEKLKKLNEVYQAAAFSASLNKFLVPNAFSLKTFVRFEQELTSKTIEFFSSNS